MTIFYVEILENWPFFNKNRDFPIFERVFPIKHVQILGKMLFFMILGLTPPKSTPISGWPEKVAAKYRLKNRDFFIFPGDPRGNWQICQYWPIFAPKIEKKGHFVPRYKP